ncbi:protein FAM180B isoform X1 [Piliocolobus tephrosceles]|uniref:Family with sequence similarity 180 member B n=1 Tax=Piliocolobus tephrosceles TaxID=591936 RepID=A0A8C9IK52_9PRIM|nr:protein FAM180B isoform X1 [Piliocolobus tephrosceles]
MTRITELWSSLQWKVGAEVCGRQMREQRTAEQSETQRTWWSMAATLQSLACLVVAICLLSGVTTTQHHAGQPMDSTSVGGGLQKPEAPEVMFELLWAGLELDVMGQLHIQDEELASTHPGRRLRLLLQHHVPSDLEGAEKRLQQLQDLRKGPPLSTWDFEHLLLTGLSCVYRLHAASEAEERGRWAQVFTLLAQETLWDLCKGFCPQDQPPSLGSWASILDPFP